MTDKPIIAVDVDEVLMPFVPHISTYYNETYGGSFTQADYKTYRFHETWGGSHSAGAAIAREFHALGHPYQIAPFAEAREALARLSERYELVIVTSRQLEFEAATVAWVETHFPGIFSRVVLANHFASSGIEVAKSELCIQLGAQWLIDDNIGYVTEISQAGLSAVLFGDYPWNQVDVLPPNVIRCSDWPAVEEYFAGK